MNAETLISQAGYAIDMYKIDHSGTLFLCIINDFVHALPAREAPQRTPSCLVITHFEQIRGLPISRWISIGKVLLKLYNKEISCHPPLKH